MSDAVITQIVQQTEALPANLQQQVLDFVRELAAFVQRGVPGEKLLRFAGMIPADDLQLMRQAIEDDCEQVDWHEW
jgi:hypothetical protein